MKPSLVRLVLVVSLSLTVTPHLVRAQSAPEIQLGKRTGATTEPFNDVLGMAELPDGRVLVSDRMWDPLESTCRHASLSIL